MLTLTLSTQIGFIGIHMSNQTTIWHPCSQMKDYETFKPLQIESAQGSYLKLKNGQKVIDAISSWWCKSLGHNHPALRVALLTQLDKFEHVILANTTNETIEKLSEKLVSLMPHLNKVFYAGDGSCAIEIAMKMSLHTRVICGEQQRKHFIALKNGYHGETVGALSMSDVGLYKKPYADMLLTPNFIEPLYVANTDDPLWHDASEHWQRVKEHLEALASTTTAILFEPILQGAGGMLIYSQDFLRRLCEWATENNIHLIADEIMTGIGRTGKMLASQHANIKPDFVCLSKGLTSGWLSFSAVLTTNTIYDIFYDDYETGKAFLHSHTFCGNALGASVALATLKVIEDENLCERADALQKIMMENIIDVKQKTGALHNLRGIGAFVAADLLEDTPRLGYKVFQEAVKRGALLRPLGNTLYWLPPLTISEETLNQLSNITTTSLKASLKYK